MENEKEKTAFMPHMIPMSEVSVEVQPWVIPNAIPRGCVTILAGDGGSHKSSLACLIASAISHGKPADLCAIFAVPVDSETSGSPMRTLILSFEDSPSKTIKQRLNAFGAAQEMIVAINTDDEGNKAWLTTLKIGTNEFATMISSCKPDLCIIDPLQCVIPDDRKMNSRQQMRVMISELTQLGEKYGTAFLLIMHTNKRDRASGRGRIADSADLWDGARSVLMAGLTDIDGQYYLSHEKSNYSELSDTIIFSRLDTGVLRMVGVSHDRDADYVLLRAAARKGKNSSSQKIDECKAAILECLDQCNDPMSMSDLSYQLEIKGYSKAAIRQAKHELRKDNIVALHNEGFGDTKKWYICRIVTDGQHQSPATEEEKSVEQNTEVSDIDSQDSNCCGRRSLLDRVGAIFHKKKG